MTKHQQYFQEMMEKNQDLFADFKKIHDLYAQNPDNWQDLFNENGKAVVEEIKEWERRLCAHSEKGQYGKFSAGLADKFWSAVRSYFPKIDFVGVKLV